MQTPAAVRNPILPGSQPETQPMRSPRYVSIGSSDSCSSLAMQSQPTHVHVRRQAARDQRRPVRHCAAPQGEGKSAPGRWAVPLERPCLCCHGCSGELPLDPAPTGAHVFGSLSNLVWGVCGPAAGLETTQQTALVREIRLLRVWSSDLGPWNRASTAHMHDLTARCIDTPAQSWSSSADMPFTFFRWNSRRGDPCSQDLDHTMRILVACRRALRILRRMSAHSDTFPAASFTHVKPHGGPHAA